MKKTTSCILIAMLTAIVILLPSCAADDASDFLIDEPMTSAEAAEEIGATLTTEVQSMGTDLLAISSGLSVSSGRSITNEVGFCGVSYDTTITTNYSGTYASYNHTVSYAYEILCQSNIPYALGFTFSSTGTREGSKLFSTGTSVGDFVIAEIFSTATNFDIEGTVARAGSTTKNDTGLIFTSAVSLEVSDLMVSKTTGNIESGTGTATLKGETPGGIGFEYSATIIFNGDDTADVTIGDYIFQIDLVTGEVTQLS